MPQRKPANIFELINSNIYAVSEDLHTLMTAVNDLSARITQLESIFKAPEQPNASGEEGAYE